METTQQTTTGLIITPTDMFQQSLEKVTSQGTEWLANQLLEKAKSELAFRIKLASMTIDDVMNECSKKASALRSNGSNYVMVSNDVVLGWAIHIVDEWDADKQSKPIATLQSAKPIVDPLIREKQILVKMSDDDKKSYSDVKTKMDALTKTITSQNNKMMELNKQKTKLTTSIANAKKKSLTVDGATTIFDFGVDDVEMSSDEIELERINSEHHKLFKANKADESKKQKLSNQLNALLNKYDSTTTTPQGASQREEDEEEKDDTETNDIGASDEDCECFDEEDSE